MDLHSISKSVAQVADEAAKFIRSQTIVQEDIQTKSKNSLVTFVDEQTEKLIIERLTDLLPEAGIMAEESASESTMGPTMWIIDPLDGTTNFIHNLPCYSVSIALVKDGEIVVGCVHEVVTDESFLAFREGGATCNGVPINVSTHTTIEESLVATGFPYYDYQYNTDYLEVLKGLMQDSRGIRRFGSAAVDLAYVACGRFDAFFEYSLNPWDVAAGSLIVQEAGGTVSDFQGGNDYLFGRRILATNSGIHPNMISRVENYFC